jgi:hypothetical protein
MSRLRKTLKDKKFGSFPANFNLATDLNSNTGYFFDITNNNLQGEHPGMILGFTLNGRPAVVIGNVHANDYAGQSYFYYTDAQLPFIINPTTYLNGQTGFTFNGTNIDGTSGVGTSFTYIPNFSGGRPVLVIGAANQLFCLYTDNGNFPQYITEDFFDGTNGFVLTNLGCGSDTQVITSDINNDGKPDLIVGGGRNTLVTYASSTAFAASTNINELLNGIAGFAIFIPDGPNDPALGSRNCNGAELLIGNPLALDGNGQVYGLLAQPNFPANFYVPDNITALNGYIINGTTNSQAGGVVAGIPNLAANDNCDAIAIAVDGQDNELLFLVFGPAPFVANILNNPDGTNSAVVLGNAMGAFSFCAVPGNPNNNGYNSLFFGLPDGPFSLQGGILYGQQDAFNGTIYVNNFNGQNGAIISGNQTISECGVAVASVMTDTTPTLAISNPEGGFYFLYFPTLPGEVADQTDVA